LRTDITLNIFFKNAHQFPVDRSFIWHLDTHRSYSNDLMQLHELRCGLQLRFHKVLNTLGTASNTNWSTHMLTEKRQQFQNPYHIYTPFSIVFFIFSVFNKLFPNSV